MKTLITYGKWSCMAACAALIAACAVNGVIPGRTSGKTVQMHFHHGAWTGAHGTISVTMPDGERFAGKFVVGTSDSTGLAFGAKQGEAALVDTSGNTSQAEAVLMGNRGDSMHCTFMLSNPSDGLEGGGVGHCKVSTGQVIDATF